MLLTASLQAQEICDNGIDDDGDNLVDVFDPDCPCDNQTLLCEPSCEFAIPGGPLSFQSQWTSAENVPNYQTPLVADIDNDGVPEVVILSGNGLQTSEPRRAKDILVINGQTGATETTITTPYLAWVGPNPVALADIDHDGFAEIIIATVHHTDNPLVDRGVLLCYEHDGTFKWRSSTTYGYGTQFGSAVGIADFNADDRAEVFVYNQIFDAETGVLLAEGGSSNGQGIMTIQAFGVLSNPVAANLTSDPGLELACGNTVYNVVLTNTSGTTGNSLTPITMPGKPDGYTSVADINLDGQMDVVVAAEGNVGELYVWEPGNGTPALVAEISLPSSGGNWVGVPFVGDMDKDCQPEIGVTRARRVYALEYDGSTTLSTRWTLTTSDASGFTGITMFDFNQDGTQELVYRDESTLRIIDGSGTTPVTIGTNTCGSGTGSEMPVVADVDGDGQAEICVTCQTLSIQIGRVNIFESTGQPWAPCRSVWNQYNYFNVNINNNLSVPIQQQDHQVLLSTVTCPFATCNQNRPFNSFLAQSTALTQDGCPIYPAADVALALAGSSCTSDSTFSISLNVSNAGGGVTVPGYPIRFYAGNPFTSAATELFAQSGPVLTTDSLLPAQIENIQVVLDISTVPKPITLFVLLNDAGIVAPPFNFPLSTLPECNYGDNAISLSNVNCCSLGNLQIGGFNPSTLSFCEGETAGVQVLASSAAGLSNALYQWTRPSGGTLTGDSIAVDEAGTWQVSVTDNVLCRVTSNVLVNEIPAPTAASAGNDQTVCEANSALEGNIPNSGTGTWTLISGSGTISNPASPTSAVSNLALGSNSFEWAITNQGICVSRDTVNITRLTPPDAAQSGANQTLCADSTQLNATAVVNGSGSWSLVSGNGTLANASSPNSAVTNLAPGINVFQWTVSVPGCTANTAQVQIQRDTLPGNAFAGSDQQVCDTETALQASGSGIWTVVSGSASLSNASQANTLIQNLPAGLTQVIWTIDGGACPDAQDTVNITRFLPPSLAVAGPDQQLCSTQAQLNATAPIVGTGNWVLASGNGTLANSSDPQTAVSNLGFGANSFTWQVSNGPCPVSEATVTVFRDTPPSAAQAGVDQNFCGTSTTLNATSPINGTGAWSILSGGGTLTSNTQAQTAISGLSAGTTSVLWTVSSGSCPSSTDTLLLQADAPLTPPNAGNDTSICSDALVLGAEIPTVGNGTWAILSGSGTLADSSNPNSALNGIGFGTTTLQWSVVNGLCMASDTLSITRSEPPSPALAGNDQQVCATTAQLAAGLPLVGTGNWTVLSGGGLLDDPSQANSGVSNLSVGPNWLLWTISSGACPSTSDSVLITVDANPISPDAGTDQQICSDQTTLAALGTGTWTLVSGGGTFADDTNPNTTVSGLFAGANTFRWTVVNGTCTASDVVTITQSLPPSPALAGNDASVCEGSSLNLNAQTPTNGSGAWSILNGTGTIAEPGSAQSSFAGTNAGVVNLMWTVSSGACPSSTDTLTITVGAAPSAAIAGNDQSICSDSLSLSAQTPVNGTGSWSILSGSGTLSNAANAQTQVSGLSPGMSTLEWSVSSPGCATNRDTLQITVSALPDVATAGNDAQICSDTLSLNANAPNQGSGLWSVITGSGSFSDASNPNALLSGVGNGVNVYQWTISSGVCPPQTDQIVVQRDSVPVQANAGPDLNVCNADTVNLQAADPFPGSGLWTVISGSGTLSNAADPQSLLLNIGLGATSLVWTVSTGNCPPTSDTVVVNLLPPPSIAQAGPDTSICATILQLNATEPQVGSGTWSVLSGTAVFGDPNAAQTEVSALSPGNTQLLWTTSNGSCLGTSDTLNITVSKNPITPNPGSDQSICADSTQLSAAAPSEGTAAWSILSGSGTLSDPNSPNAWLNNIAVGTTTLQWTITNGSCVVSASVAITRTAPPDTAIAGADITVCADTLSLSATAPQVGNGIWSVLSGVATLSDASNPQSAVSALGVGTNVLLWTVSNGSCSPNIDTVLVTRVAQPDTAFAGNDLSICADTASLQANTPTVGTGSWTLVSGTATLSDPNNPALTLTGIGIGTTVLRWTISTGNGCPDQIDEVSIVRATPPDAAVVADDYASCTQPVNLSANSPSNGTGQWLVVAGNGVVLDANAPNTTASGLSIGNNVFEWRISNGSCPPETDQITISLGDTAYAGPDQTLCDSSATLTAVLPSGGSGTWTLVSGSGTLVNPDSVVCVVNGLAPGPNVFAWTLHNNPCPDSTDQVIITRSCNQPPIITNDSVVVWEDSTLTGNVLDSLDFDPDSTALVADTLPVSGPTNGTITLEPDGGFTYIPNPNFYGNDTVVVQICDQGTPLPALCGLDTLVIVVQPVNDPPILVNDTVQTTSGTAISGNLLNNDSDIENTTLSSDSVAVDAGNGTFVLNSDGSFTYTPDSAFIGTDTVVVWVCDSGFPDPPECGLDTVFLVVGSPSLNADAGSDQTRCQLNALLNGNAPPEGATGVWTQIAGSGTLETPNDSICSVTQLSEGLNTFVWTISQGAFSVSDTVQITAYAAPSPAFAGEDQSVCGAETELQGSSATIGSPLWSSSGAGVVISSPNQPITFVAQLDIGPNILVYTISNGTCVNRDTVVVNRFETPQAWAGNDTSLCPQALPWSTEISVGPGSWSWSLISGSGTVGNAGTSNPVFDGLQTGENSFLIQTSNGPCSASDTLNVVLLDAGDAPCSSKEVFIPEGFSPNNDNAHDRFVIYHTEGKSVRLEVYNRWGNLVYQADNYQNDWDGTANTGPVLMGEKLPESTYYYLITIEGENETRKGYLTLWR